MKHLSLKASLTCTGLFVLYSSISPSPGFVSMLPVFTAFPTLEPSVLNRIFASAGRSGTSCLMFMVDAPPKLRTIMKTLLSPSSSLTYAKTFKSLHV
uniref:Uncharacterized protein n=1 Tax=Xenopus tropicalis TaxID=8364 RepID=A0A6I8QJN4_XENTR